MAATVSVGLLFVTETCIECGIVFAIEKDWQARLRDKHSEFYCPRGHAMHYLAESEAERLKREKAALELRLQREQAERDREVGELRARLSTAGRKAKAAQRKLKSTVLRVNAGVCPHCHRTVRQLAEHMASKHPEHAPKGATDGRPVR